jgi:prepilin peptidase CpaA
MLNSLSMLLLDGRTGVLVLLLAGAAVCDYRTHRIPNWLVLVGVLYSLIYNMMVPSSPQASVLFALAGLGLGLILLLPLYFLRAIGAGDVKLVAMTGAFLGAAEIIPALVITMIVGGALSIAFALVRGTARRMFHNLASVLQVGLFSALSGFAPNLRIAAEASAGKLPYGVAIAIGTIGYLVMRQPGFF